MGLGLPVRLPAPALAAAAAAAAVPIVEGLGMLVALREPVAAETVAVAAAGEGLGMLLPPFSSPWPRAMAAEAAMTVAEAAATVADAMASANEPPAPVALGMELTGRAVPAGCLAVGPLGAWTPAAPALTALGMREEEVEVPGMRDGTPWRLSWEDVEEEVALFPGLFLCCCCCGPLRGPASERPRENVGFAPCMLAAAAADPLLAP